MRNNYCTLFDSNYLSRGLLMYASLIRQDPSAHLFIVAFNEECRSLLIEMALSNATVISLAEFENDKLLEVKKTRTAAEYCWTCTPSVIDFVIKEYDVPACTYLDADLYFYADPVVLINEMPPGYSVLITSHRYSPQYDQTATSGIYCVQFVTFKNNPDSLRVLEWWRDACIEWCYNRMEDGKFGDQKYLDDWTTRFKGIVWELENLGGGIAPWNVQQYTFDRKAKSLTGIENRTGKKFDPVFFHFHALSFKKTVSPFGEKQMVNFRSGYELPENAVELIYEPYSQLLLITALRMQNQYQLKIVNSQTEKISAVRVLKNKIKSLLNKKTD